MRGADDIERHARHVVAELRATAAMLLHDELWTGVDGQSLV